MCLADAVTAGHTVRAFLVLGGDGWKRRDYFTSAELSEYLIPPPWSAFSSWKPSSCSQRRAVLIVPAFTLSVFA
jgi:hypothetical protein